MPTAAKSVTPTVFYRTLNVEGLEIFYREAGPRDAPTVLLLHGFPSSSHMFRNLIPMLADKYHVVAPDFPGYGESSAPLVNDFEYSYERLAIVTEKFSSATPSRSALAWYRSLRTTFVTRSGPITRCGSQPALLGLTTRGLTAGWRWWGKIGGDGHPNRLNRSS
jgi:hypothetical protein